MRLADYVESLERRYVEKFPGYEATIRKAVRRSANRHGREVFGGSGADLNTATFYYANAIGTSFYGADLRDAFGVETMTIDHTTDFRGAKR